MEEGCIILTASDKKKKDIKTILWYAGVILVGALFFTFVVGLTKIDGDSMLPTLHDGQYVFTNKAASYFNSYGRGDIVIIDLDNGGSIVKRIVALGGDTVEITSNSLCVNGEVIDTSQNSEDNGFVQSLQVPEGCVYVLGDNRLHSCDSRELGCIEVSSIKGKVMFH